MASTRVAPALLTLGLLAGALTACGSDSNSGGPEASRPEAGGPAAGGGAPDSPCDLTDQATVASVFPGASAGKPGQSRNCTYTYAKGTVNVFLFTGDLEGYKKQAKDADVKFTPVQVGDAAIKDQLHTITVQQGDVLFGVQTLGSSVREAKLAAFDGQTLALARKIAAQL